MACSNCKTKPVWKFTNQIQLCKKCFINYFERKVFRTIRKYNLLPKDKIIILKKSDDLNTKVLKHVLEGKFSVKYGKPNLSSENLSQLSERIFLNVIKGNFSHQLPASPLYFLSGKEVELYAKIKGVKGEKIKFKRKIKKLFERFIKKNPDLEHNIVNASNQLKK